VKRCGTDLIELSRHHNFELWLPEDPFSEVGHAAFAGSLAEGIAWIENEVGTIGQAAQSFSCHTG
jgi:hypothetical protein